MSFNQMMGVIVVVVIGLFYITEQGYDYNEFVEFVRSTQPHKEKKAQEIPVAVIKKNYGGNFKPGDCVKVDDVDYYKIVNESESAYEAYSCKFTNNECNAIPTQEGRADFDLTYSFEDKFDCP